MGRTTAPPEATPDIRHAPAPLHGGPVALLRFMARHRMLTPKYARLLVRLGLRKLRHGRRLVLDGLAFIGPRVVLQIKRNARIELGPLELPDRAIKTVDRVDQERPLHTHAPEQRELRCRPIRHLGRRGE